jgi:hypothetical protein
VGVKTEIATTVSGIVDGLMRGSETELSNVSDWSSVMVIVIALFSLAIKKQF